MFSSAWRNRWAMKRYVLVTMAMLLVLAVVLSGNLIAATGVTIAAVALVTLARGVSNV